MAFEAIALTSFVLAGNTLLRPLVNAINRAPINQSTAEAFYEVRVTASAGQLDETRELLRRKLASASYPVRDIEVSERDGEVELVTTLVGTAIDPRELDAIISDLKRNRLVENAAWSVQTAD